MTEHADAQVPPSDLDAEESVLGALLLSPRAIELVQPILDPADFYRGSHARIYQAALALHHDGQPVDGVTVADRLAQTGQLDDVGGKERVHELAALVPDAARAPHWARIVARIARTRRVAEQAAAVHRRALELADVDELEQELRDLADTLGARAPGGRIAVEDWHTFETQAHDRIPCLVEGLWPEAAFGFIAAPPKKGKTWVALALALSIAAGKSLFGTFAVPAARPVLYVALEGHRAALRARIGAIARGAGLNPDEDDLENLHLAYRPPGINLADAGWARELTASATSIGAALIVVDVLRAAAAIKENDQGEFAQLRRNLEPATDAGISIALLHHFGKLTELQRDRDPGERMSGTGAMFGALDVAIYITGSEDHARRLRLDFDTRDIAAPDHINLALEGDGSGDNGGFTYRDAATFTITTAEVEEDDLKAPPAELYDWIEKEGGDVYAKHLRAHFGISHETLTRRLGRLLEMGVQYVGGRGKPSRLVIDPDPGEVSAQLQFPHAGTQGEAETFPLEQAKKFPLPASFRTGTNGNSESAHLQGNQVPALPAPPTEETPPAAQGGSSEDDDPGRPDEHGYVLAILTAGEPEHDDDT